MNTTQRSVQYSEAGGPEVLEVVRAPIPEAGDGKVLVRVRAVGLNPFDSKTRTGEIPSRQPFPRGLGGDFAGEVVEVGPAAAYTDGAPVRTGDEVLGWGVRTLRERIAVSASHLARKPASLSFAVAGSLTTPGLTAQGCFDVLEPGEGDTVLVAAASGAVGFLFSQLAVAAGARVVGTAGVNNHERLSAIGVTPVTYGPGLLDRVRTAAPEGITKVQDGAGGDTIDVALELGVAPEAICELVDQQAVERLGLSKPQGDRRADVLERLADRVASGELVLPVQAEYPFEEVAEAFRVLETRHLSGKIVVAP